MCCCCCCCLCRRFIVCCFHVFLKPSCSCKEGFSGDNPDAGCSLIDVCPNSSCDKSAKCVTVLPGDFECVCGTGHISNGSSCFGPLLKVIRTLVTSDYSPDSLRMFENGCSLTLNKMGPFTVFLPLVRDMETRRDGWSCQLHIIPGAFLLQDLLITRTFWTLTGDPVEVLRDGENIELLIHNNSYGIVQSNVGASNGILHIIDGFISGNNSENLEDQRKTVAEILAKEHVFQRFQIMLENIEYPELLKGPGPFTVFVPSNRAVDKLRDGTLFYMFTEGRLKLQELVKHHILSSARLTVDRLATIPRILSKANQIISINVDHHGQITLGDKAVPLYRRDIIASDGVIHSLDGILIPPSIIPILPKQCNKIHHHIVTAPCGDCSALSSRKCPEGAAPMETYDVGCKYDASADGVLYSRKLGCAQHCNQTIVKPACCKGFYGRECRACPGGFKEPCYAHGECIDGIKGNGSCKCHPNFKGIACHICSHPNKHGTNCEQDCLCLHGSCDNRPENSGICLPNSCEDGFMGNLCDTRTETCGSENLSQYCHAFAECTYTNNTVRCVCKSGYEGNGLSCQSEDVCRRSDRGGCDRNAECVTLGPGNASCICNTGWSGDGHVCTEINECLLNMRGGCHSNADCQYIGPGQSSCVCRKGFAGNGKICTARDPCLQSNGGCHLKAECKATESGSRECTCPEGYGGDGIICFRDVLSELAGSSYFSGFNAWLQKCLLRTELRGGANVTVLAPSDAAIKDMNRTEKAAWEQSRSLCVLVRSHILVGGFSTDQLMEHRGQDLQTLNTFITWPVASENGTLSVAGARVLMADIPAVNGFIHIIDQVLVPPWEDVAGHCPGLLEALGNLSQYSLFTQALQLYGLVEVLEAAVGYTVLLPSDAALTQYSQAQRLPQLEEDSVKYHLILGEKLLFSNIKAVIRKETMLGVSYRITFSADNDQVFANDIPLEKLQVETRNGILLGVSRVLPVLRNHCNIREIDTVQGQCGSCDQPPVCPQGTTPVELPGQDRTPDCSYKEYQYQQRVTLSGCKPNCTRVTVLLGCCSGYFGPGCEMCPGGPGVWCSGSGICQDGLNGTGECLCQEGFQGTACESCEAGRYGPTCKLECRCVNGKCRDGLAGNGSCDCNKGWSGADCDVEIVSDTCNGTCHPHANCVPGMASSTPSCVCTAGYTGNGTSCSEWDPCERNNGGCSMSATCTKVSAGERTCSCVPGFTGDGVVCVELDGCALKTCGEHEECIKTAAGRVACTCVSGYVEDSMRMCKPVDPCTQDNGGCSLFAKCVLVGPGVRLCRCVPGYIGVGFSCRGRIFEELARLPAMSVFSQQLQRNLFRELSLEGPFTLFLPDTELTAQDNTVEEWERRGLVKDLLWYHLVGCRQLLHSKLIEQSSLIALSGHRIHITVRQNSVYLNGDSQIVRRDYVTANGIIHYISKVLVPHNLTLSEAGDSVPAPLKNLTTVAEENGYKRFSDLVKEVGLMPVIADPLHRPFTMFWPTDEALAALLPAQQHWLYSNQNLHHLLQVLNFHIISDWRIDAVDFPLKIEPRTMQGSTLSITCSRFEIGALMLNDGAAQIVQRHLVFDGGIAYGINGLLEPPHLGARCDTFTRQPVSGICGNCSAVPRCLPGTKLKGGMLNYHRNCWYVPRSHRSAFGSVSHSSRTVPGCSADCLTPVWLPQCCKHHYGHDCQACPGGARSPCSNRGHCSDGWNGRGTCWCNEGFTGTACELCGPSRFGANCTSCTCTKNGRCDEGKTGKGTCFCSEGWTGDHCQSQLEALPVCSPKCHHNAVCQANNVCECELYYEGDGRMCVVADLCRDNNGGCSGNANCTQLGVTISCSCGLGYMGDGHVCTAVSKCEVERNGGCSEHAVCINLGAFTRKCECKSGFRGNGIQCLKNISPPVNRCLDRNGLCHPDAICIDLHFQDTTMGVFHWQSPRGKYSFTYTEAMDACVAEGATLATFSQLAAAQQFGYHLCTVGWLEGSRAGYPTTTSNPNCASSDNGIIDYGVRKNSSELWDAYCFRARDVECWCAEGFVGDGYSCHGNLVQVLSSDANFSRFYSQLLDFARSSKEGLELLTFLSEETTRKTLFVPIDSGFGENETLSWRDLENHVSENHSLHYSQMMDGLRLRSRLGNHLLIADGVSDNHTRINGSKLVNGRRVVQWDIEATNGIIQVIEAPLQAPGAPALASHSLPKALVVTVLLAVIGLVAAGVGLSCYWLRRKNDNFHFHYFKSEEDDDDDKPAVVSVPNPLYSAYGAAVDSTEPFDDYGDYSDTQNIIQD
ncbi:stabilin-1 isoform X2 [Callorhinchus milii]|uniref:stabilin-1 isoform X2 n=1 Tax=Callorhinchus milii TaxID=7868 RepID=UPI001C3F5324|nr:stabilin-1 isoform X2 [Callorhinchus milii]